MLEAIDDNLGLMQKSKLKRILDSAPAIPKSGEKMFEPLTVEYNSYRNNYVTNKIFDPTSVTLSKYSQEI